MDTPHEPGLPVEGTFVTPGILRRHHTGAEAHANYLLGHAPRVDLRFNINQGRYTHKNQSEQVHIPHIYVPTMYFFYLMIVYMAVSMILCDGDL